MKIIRIIALVFSMFSIVNMSVYAAPETGTDSADINADMIKENIKKRLEQVVKNQNTDSKKKVAYLGTISSITTTSYMLETNQGDVKQASTSANTTFIELSKNKEMKADDVAIGDYVAMLGFENDTLKVLDARRVLVLKTPPSAPRYKTAYGMITKIDVKKNTLTFQLAQSSDTKMFKISTKTPVFLTDGSVRRNEIDIKDITLMSQALIVYDPVESTNKAAINTGVSVLIKSSTPIASPSPSPSVKPTPSPKPSPTTKPRP